MFLLIPLFLFSSHHYEVLTPFEESQETTTILLIFAPHFQFFQKTYNLWGNKPQASWLSSSHQGLAGTGFQSCLHLWRPLSQNQTTAGKFCQRPILHLETWAQSQCLNSSYIPHRDQLPLEHPPSSHFGEWTLADMGARSESHSLLAPQEEPGFLSPGGSRGSSSYCISGVSPESWLLNPDYSGSSRWKV